MTEQNDREPRTTKYRYEGPLALRPWIRLKFDPSYVGKHRAAR